MIISKLAVENPNLSIIVPGGCNGKCNFCFWKEEAPIIEEEYFKKLNIILTYLPKEFSQISITGGEPCLSSFLPTILDKIYIKNKRWPKVVLTTNGTCLIKQIDVIRAKVNFLNISRHHFNEEENSKIFNSKTICPNNSLNFLIKELKGVNITLNCVLRNEYSKTFISEYLNFAYMLGIKSVCFRKQHGSLAPSKYEIQYNSCPVTCEGGCPVCRSKTQIIDGVEVTWKASATEPSKELNGIYELIYHPTGKLTADWEGNVEIGNLVNIGSPYTKYLEIEKNIVGLPPGIYGDLMAQAGRQLIKDVGIDIDREIEKLKGDSMKKTSAIDRAIDAGELLLAALRDLKKEELPREEDPVEALESAMKRVKEVIKNTNTKAAKKLIPSDDRPSFSMGDCGRVASSGRC